MKPEPYFAEAPEPATGPRFPNRRRLNKEKLDKLEPGSIVKVYDPDASVWYWVVIQKRLNNDRQWFEGRIDSMAIAGSPSLRNEGTVFFHENNVLYIWPYGLYKGGKPWWRGLLGGGGVKTLAQAPNSLLGTME